MDFRMSSTETGLTALMIAPNRELARQLRDSLRETRSFHILKDLEDYPSVSSLDTRLRQLKPDVVLLDLSTNREQVEDLIRSICSFQPAVYVVGLHTSNDPGVIIRSLRLGASEFLHTPFAAEVQRAAVGRIKRLLEPDTDAPAEVGKVIGFSSTKPGSGATTLACQTALALKRISGKRVLLIDLDLTGGAVGFHLRVDHSQSVLKVMEQEASGSSAPWATLAAHLGGLEVMPAPSAPQEHVIEVSHLKKTMERTRLHYDWVILDLPVVFHRTSLIAIAESDRAFLVATPRLPSLHMARKAANLLRQIGLGMDRFQILLNRSSGLDGFYGSEMETALNCTVDANFPDDGLPLTHGITHGEAVSSDSGLGRAVEDFAGRLCGQAFEEQRSGGFQVNATPAYSEM